MDPNVTRDGKTIKVKRATLTGANADFAKRVVKLTIEITLDDAVLACRDDLAFWKFDLTPIQVTLKPITQQLDLLLPDGVTSVTLGGMDDETEDGEQP